MRMSLEWLAALMLAGAAHAADPEIHLPPAGMGGALAAAPGEEETEGSNTSDVVCTNADSAVFYGDESIYKSAAGHAPADRGFSGVDPGTWRVLTDITFDDDGGVAVVSMSGRTPGCSKGKGDNIRTRGWSVKLAYPIDDADGGFAHIATLDGFSGGLQLHFEKTWSSKPVSFLEDLHHDKKFEKICGSIKAASQCSLGDILQYYSDLKTRDVGLGMDDMSDSESAILRDEILEHRRAGYRQIREYAVSLKAGEGTFDYLTPHLGEGSVHRIGWSVGVSASFVPAKRDSMWAIGLSYGRAYRAGRDVILCPPTTGATPVECVAGPLGAPTEYRSKRVWGEYRRGISDFAYSLKVTHDFGSDRTAVDLPIYFLRVEQGQPTGGIRLGWSSEDDFMLGFFLSAPFNLRKR